ncbi:MAG TPA: ribulokinase [Gemmatimonadaceae bacterium]|nr:ribulokinase [Gemmatimonadaceae bacterium]
MTLVAGVDFGTQSVRVSIVDHQAGVIGSGVAEYPVNRSAADPDFATQSYAAQMDGLVSAMRAALGAAKVEGRTIRAIALDTTGSTVCIVGRNMVPLDDCYLWCDHRAKAEAARITEVARTERLPAIELCGGTYSTEWGFSKLLHWLRHNPRRRDDVVAAVEHCDLVAATLSGITDPDWLPRSICAMGHKWLWSAAHGGFPSEGFLAKVDPLLAGSHRLLRGRYLLSDKIAGQLSAEWAGRLGLSAGIPIPVGALDAHWDAIGAGIAEGDVVNVVGSSTCTMAIAKSAASVPGVCGVVPGSIHPDFIGIEAGLSATGDIFDAIARRANTTVGELSKSLGDYRACQTGLLRLTWDNGDRTVLVNPHLGGVTLGWNLGHTAQDELFAAIEGTAFHTRLILERMAEHGVPIRRLIHGGGIPQRSDVLNRVYANVLGIPVLIPERPTTSLGAAIFGFVAIGAFASVADAQKALCSPYREVATDAGEHAVYERLHEHYRSLYFALGTPDAAPAAIGRVLPDLQAIAADARSTQTG